MSLDGLASMRCGGGSNLTLAVGGKLGLSCRESVDSYARKAKKSLRVLELFRHMFFQSLELLQVHRQL